MFLEMILKSRIKKKFNIKRYEKKLTNDFFF